ncbi:hypothetical protein G7Y79_00068g096050 [Physcia stellaris]|nr:hypothetical protein G7Y79_00068g096050 [Physcia stellaris]
MLFCIGAAHPRHGQTTIRSRKLLDPNKFETEALPRDSRGFQPRDYSQTSEAASSVVTEQNPRTFTSPQETLSGASAVQHHIIGEPGTVNDDSRASRTIENPETAISNRVIPLANNARKANQASPMAQFSAAKALTNERSNAGILPEDVKILEQLDQNGGLGASMWAQPPQKSLSNLPGLRPHPTSPPKWDSSNGFKVSDIRGRYSINLLPKYAFNNGVKPKTINKSIAPTNGITMPPREILSADTKDAKTIARTREEHNNTVVVSDAVVTTSPKPVSTASTHYVPPHLRKQNKVTVNRDVPQQLPVSEPQQKNIEAAKASHDKSTEANPESFNFLSTKPSATRSTDSAQDQAPITGVSPVIISSSPLAPTSPPAVSQYKTETSASHHASPVILPNIQGEANLVSDSAKFMKEMEQELPHIFEYQKPS